MKNIAKKTLALALALCLCLCLGATAFAASPTETGDPARVNLKVVSTRGEEGGWDLKFTASTRMTSTVANLLADTYNAGKTEALENVNISVVAESNELHVGDEVAIEFEDDLFELVSESPVSVEEEHYMYVDFKLNVEALADYNAFDLAKHTVTVDATKHCEAMPRSDAKVYVYAENLPDSFGGMVLVAEGSNSGNAAGGGAPAIGGSTGSTENTENTDNTETTPVTEVFSDMAGLSKDEIAAVQFVYDAKLMEGYPDGTFGPEDNDTRAMFATVLFRLLGQEGDSTDASFEDVEDGEWYSEAVAWAAANGYVLGYGDGTFGVDDNITREQIITILWRSVGSPEAEAVEGASDWAAEAMGWAVEFGIIEADVEPTVDATRLEMAEYVTNFALLIVAATIVAAAE